MTPGPHCDHCGEPWPCRAVTNAPSCTGCGYPCLGDIEHRSPAGDLYCRLACAFKHGVKAVHSRHKSNFQER